MPLTYTFDALGRVQQEVNVLGTFAYTYDGVSGRLATVTYPNNQTSAYTYSPAAADHRLQQILHRYPNGNVLSQFDYTYDAVGNILSWRQQADTTAVLWEYGYDGADQLTRAVKRATDPQGTILQRIGYGYDAAGNRLYEQIDEAVTSWTYDRLNRLVTQQAGGTLRVAGTVNEPATVRVNGQPATVDANGAFSGGVPVASGTTRFTIAATDASGNATTASYDVDQTGASKTFTFDANGNLTADGTRTFEWDARNQLVAVNVGTHRSEYTYDGQQRRVRILEKEGGSVQADGRLIWCDGGICEERTADGAAVIRRSFSDGEQRGGAAHFFAGDHLGSVHQESEASGAVIAAHTFDPWGRSTTTGDPKTTVGYTGHETTVSGGIYLALYRAYDPSLGRWLSEDPIGISGGINLFSYVEGRPTVDYDEYGLKVSCTSTLTKKNVKRTNCGGSHIGGCTTPDSRTYAQPCKRESQCGTWGFNAWVQLNLLVEFNAPRTAPSKETKGATLEAHEMLHVADLRRWCAGLDKAIQSEGFGTKPECDRAYARFESDVRVSLARAAALSHRRRD